MDHARASSVYAWLPHLSTSEPGVVAYLSANSPESACELTRDKKTAFVEAAIRQAAACRARQGRARDKHPGSGRLRNDCAFGCARRDLFDVNA